MKLFDKDVLKHLKSECGGLQTLLRNHNSVFNGEDRTVNSISYIYVDKYLRLDSHDVFQVVELLGYLSKLHITKYRYMYAKCIRYCLIKKYFFWQYLLHYRDHSLLASERIHL